MSRFDNLFQQYDELAQDVARSTTEFFQGNLRRWLALLDGAQEFATPILQELESSADFPTWFEPYRLVAMGHGTKKLQWPNELKRRLGLQLLLFRQFANGGIDPKLFAFAIMRTSEMANDGSNAIIEQMFAPMQRELRRYLSEVVQDEKPETHSTTASALKELKLYDQRLTAILNRFTRARDGIHIHADDDAAFRQHVRELIDLFNDLLGSNQYSQQLATDFNDGISNFYHSPSYASVESIIGVVRAALTRLERNPQLLTRRTMASSLPNTDRIFIVHGHSGKEQAVARFLTLLGLQPIILHEQANQGRTIIEKFEAHSDVAFAVVLLTADDLGGARNGPQKPRARQNVILELGYFIGQLSRERVCALLEGGVEIPSDILGIAWESLDDRDAWKLTLARELKAAGYDCDWSAIANT